MVNTNLKIVFITFIIISLLFLIIFKLYSTGLTVGELTVGIDEGIIVIYDEFKSGDDTLDFLSFNDIELQTIENLTLENSYGKIVINEVVNLTEDEIGNIINLDEGVDISFNLIEVNTTILTSFANKSGNLSLYGLTFITPLIYKDGILCSSECEEISYSGGTLLFSVENLSSFYIVEGYEEGDGGTSQTDVASFYLSKDLLKFVINQGETLEKNIAIVNNGTLSLIILVNNTLRNLLIIDDTSFELDASESMGLRLFAFSKEKEIPEIYLGEVIFTVGILEKVLHIIIEVKERNPIFDMLVRISPKVVTPGEEITATIQIINLGNLQNIDLNLEYGIKDFKNNTVLFYEESILIKEKLNIKRNIFIPYGLEPDKYVIYTKISYNDVTAFASEAFELKAKSKSEIIVMILIISLIFLIILTGFMIYILRKRLDKSNKN